MPSGYAGDTIESSEGYVLTQNHLAEMANVSRDVANRTLALSERSGSISSAHSEPLVLGRRGRKGSMIRYGTETQTVQACTRATGAAPLFGQLPLHGFRAGSLKRQRKLALGGLVVMDRLVERDRQTQKLPYSLRQLPAQLRRPRPRSATAGVTSIPAVCAKSGHLPTGWLVPDRPGADVGRGDTLSANRSRSRDNPIKQSLGIADRGIDRAEPLHERQKRRVGRNKPAQVGDVGARDDRLP